MAAAGGFWAARAAHRSEVTAQEATERAERVDRRGLLRDLIITAHRVVSESIQVGSLTEELKTEYRALATFFGQSGGSKEKLFIHRVELKHKGGMLDERGGTKLIEERTYLCNSSEENFMQALSKFDGYLIHVLRIKDSLQREIATVAVITVFTVVGSSGASVSEHKNTCRSLQTRQVRNVEMANGDCVLP